MTLCFLTSCTGGNMRGVSVSTAVNSLCSVVTCELKAKRTLFLGWCQWTEADMAIGIHVWNIPFGPWKVWSSIRYRPLWGQRHRKYAWSPVGSANHWTLTESMGERHFTWTLNRKTNTQQIIKKKISFTFANLPNVLLLPWILNIPSSRNADVPKSWI